MPRWPTRLAAPGQTTRPRSRRPTKDRSERRTTRTSAPRPKAGSQRLEGFAGPWVGALLMAQARWPMNRSRQAGWEVLVLSAFASTCAPRPRSEDPRPIEVIVATDPETLDPRYSTDAVGLRTTRLIHAGLARMDPDTLEPVPYAARSWRWIDDRTLRVELRDDVRFHSGAPLSPLDVVETLRAMASP